MVGFHVHVHILASVPTTRYAVSITCAEVSSKRGRPGMIHHVTVDERSRAATLPQPLINASYPSYTPALLAVSTRATNVAIGR